MPCLTSGSLVNACLCFKTPKLNKELDAVPWVWTGAWSLIILAAFLNCEPPATNNLLPTKDCAATSGAWSLKFSQT